MKTSIFGLAYQDLYFDFFFFFKSMDELCLIIYYLIVLYFLEINCTPYGNPLFIKIKVMIEPHWLCYYLLHVQQLKGPDTVIFLSVAH